MWMRRADWTARWWWWPIGGAVLAVAFCLLITREAGYPLDDAWIHQDFARTLATTGRFAFLPGESGAGSTSPLWVVLLLPPQLMFHGQPPLAVLVGWTALLGGVALAGMGIAAGAVARELARRAGFAAPLVDAAGLVAGLAVVLEWHLVWAAISGMETVLFGLVVTVLFLAAGRGMRPVALGLLTALAITVRPEAALAGLLVVGGSLWMAAVGEGARGRLVMGWVRRWLAPYMAGVLVGSVPYVGLNLVASGHLLPSTFYAKASFYAAGNYLRAAASDLGGLAVDLVGSSPVALLLPALSYSHWLLRRQDTRARRGAAVRGTAVHVSGRTAGTWIATLRARIARQAVSWWAGAPTENGGAVSGAGASGAFPLRGVLWLWVVGLVGVYAGRGVATFVHGRYLMPVLPALIALTSVGAAALLLDQRRRMLRMVAASLLVGAALFSVVRGAQIYRDNVRFIDATQVAAAQWLREHAAPHTLVATHDIGAIGYLSGRSVVDIAGLADPEVIPLLRDQPALEAYLRQRHVAYVVIYITWFPPPNVLVRDLAGREVFRTAGSQSLVIYRTGW